MDLIWDDETGQYITAEEFAKEEIEKDRIANLD